MSIFSRNWGFIPGELQARLRQTRILVAGSGLGSVIAEMSARTGFGRFILADGDTVECSNLNRQAFNQSDIGRNKAAALAERLRAIHPEVEITVIEDFFTADTITPWILKADLVVNTIDFDHPAFLHCNRIARENGTPVLFPLNIGFGGALFVFTRDSASLEETIGLSPDRPWSFHEIQEVVIRKALGNAPPGYLAPLAQRFRNPTPQTWPHDPQLAIGAAVSSSLTITAMVSLIAGWNVLTAPNCMHADIRELVSGN